MSVSTAVSLLVPTLVPDRLLVRVACPLVALVPALAPVMLRTRVAEPLEADVPAEVPVTRRERVSAALAPDVPADVAVSARARVSVPELEEFPALVAASSSVPPDGAAAGMNQSSRASSLPDVTPAFLRSWSWLTSHVESMIRPRPAVATTYPCVTAIRPFSNGAVVVVGSHNRKGTVLSYRRTPPAVIQSTALPMFAT